MITVKINGIEFTYNDELYYEKNTHIYCKTCNKQIDGKPMKLLNKQIIFKVACECDREKEEQEKKREKFLEQEKLRESCFISKVQHNYRFDNCDEYIDIEVIRKSKNYVKYFEEMRKDNIGLLFYGNVGSGKTYIACSIANQIIEEYFYTVKVRNFAQILNDLQKGGFNLNRNEYIDSITNSTLLILDDFGIERNTEYALEQIYNIINVRYLKSKLTIITTNINFKDIEREQEDMMLGRIYSRIIDMCLPIRVVGVDKRKLRRKEKMRRTQKLINE